MKPYEEYLEEEFINISNEFPVIINTAKEFNEGFNIVLAAIKRRTNAHDEVLIKWLKKRICE